MVRSSGQQLCSVVAYRRIGSDPGVVGLEFFNFGEPITVNNNNNNNNNHKIMNTEVLGFPWDSKASL